MTDDEWQRLKNFTIYKVWMTDKELEDAAPWLAIGALVVIVAVILFILVVGRDHG